MKLLKEFRARHSKFELTRQELSNAEKLFDLSITSYPHIMDMEKDLRGMAQVFDLYEAQRVSTPVQCISCLNILRDVARKKYRAVDECASSKPSAKLGSLPMKNLKTIIMLLHVKPVVSKTLFLLRCN